MISLVDLKSQYQAIKQPILQAMEEVINHGQFIIGPKVKELEHKMKVKLGVDHAVTVANGTDALVLTLDAYGIGLGDEVITTPFTFFATAEAISRVGATPVFSDIDRQTYNIDPSGIEDKITSATRAIIVVHLFGQPAPMRELSEIANKHRLLLIEDACQAFGATYEGRQIGSIGDAACFSFFPSKNLGTMGDGGMIVTSDSHLAEKLRKLRHHGSTVKYMHDDIGYNSRLDELHAAIILIGLKHIDEWNALRRQRATRYNEQLHQVPHLSPPVEAADRTHIYHLYCIYSTARAQLMSHLAQHRIQSGVYYPCPLHLQKVYQGLGYSKGDFPVAEEMAECLLAIPMSPFLSEADQHTVISTLQSFGGRNIDHTS